MCAVETPAGEIPAQKLTEEQLRRLLETSRAIPWAADARTWLFTYVGPQAVELLGYSREQWLEKDFWVKRIHPDDQEEAVGYCESASRLYQDYEFEYRMLAADGRIVWLHDIVHVVKRGDSAESLQGFMIDITDRKRADEERRQHQAELAHLSRVATMGEFSAALAHELNQPLAAILANARAAERFLEQGVTDSTDLNGALHDIVGAAKRAGELISRMRALMRKGEAEHQPVEINETIRGIESFVQAEALRCNVELDLDLAPNLPQVQGDPIELQQVILNLVNNGLESMEHADDGNGKLTIRTDRHESGTLLVAVEDSGPPLDEGALELMFEPFYSTRDDGLGIGLSLSRSIIKAHGGELWATVNPERGVTLQFTVPCDEPTAP